MKKINRTYSFNEDTLRQLRLLMNKYNTNNASELIRMLIENEYNRLQNPNLHADLKDKSLSEIEYQLQRLIKIQEQNNEWTYEIRDMTNSYANFVDCEDFCSADVNMKNAKINKCMIESRENYQTIRHNRTVEKAMMRSNIPPEKR